MGRPIAGRLRYPTPPEPGTILGPTRITREFLVVLGQEPDGRTLLGYAQRDELTTSAALVVAGGAPRSVAEHRAVEIRRKGLRRP